jgi:hypothetical protein
VLACYVVNTSSEDSSGKKKCAPVLEDYYECLHHRKEVTTPTPTPIQSPIPPPPPPNTEEEEEEQEEGQE